MRLSDLHDWAARAGYVRRNPFTSWAALFAGLSLGGVAYADEWRPIPMVASVVYAALAVSWRSKHEVGR